MEGIKLQMINRVFFFRYLKGRCNGNQFCGKIVAKLATHPALINMSCRNGMAYRLVNIAFIAPVIALHGVKMVKISSVVFELK